MSFSTSPHRLIRDQRKATRTPSGSHSWWWRQAAARSYAIAGDRPRTVWKPRRHRATRAPQDAGQRGRQKSAHRFDVEGTEARL